MSKPLRILVVDDEPLLRDYARDLLIDAGYQVDVAADAEQALNKLGGTSFNLVVTDICMPGALDGLAFAQRVARQFPTTRVALMTGRELPSLDEVPDGTFLMLKPFSSEHLTSLARFSADYSKCHMDATNGDILDPCKTWQSS